jgi:3,4-dihydroxy 2-butanone 4-phosphate synthase/GTP cyclohydrolase II
MASNTIIHNKNLQNLQEALGKAEKFRKENSRPFITVSYAQSVDGSIASRRKEQMFLSGQESLVLTHVLRSYHHAILIGIETVLIDNPRLTVRLVDGPDPQPIVLDSRLRIPHSSQLVRKNRVKPWVISTNGISNKREKSLHDKGVQIIQCTSSEFGRIDINALVKLLADKGVNSIMIEGGAQVISDFIAKGLVDQFVITITPQLVGGLRVIDSLYINPNFELKLDMIEYQRCGQDLILWAKPLWT